MNAIVVVDRNWAIGRENHLLYSLPTDMKRFRSLTLDGTVILGRKTLDTFPGGRPLPQRKNIVITHNVDFDREGCEVASGLAAALDLAAGTPDDRIWVIGGGSVYAALLSKIWKKGYRGFLGFEFKQSVQDKETDIKIMRTFREFDKLAV